MNNTPINSGWRFSPSFDEAMLEPTYDDSAMEEVCLPHTVKQLPFNYFDEKDYQLVSGYRKCFVAPEEWASKVLLLRFDGVAHQAEVYVNEAHAASHNCGYTAFCVDITPYITPGSPVVIALRVDSRESLNQPPFGGVVDYLAYGGVYREAAIEVKNPAYIKDAFITTPGALGKVKRVVAAIELAGASEGRWELKATVEDEEGGQLAAEALSGAGAEGRLELEVPDARLWQLDAPVLYRLRLELWRQGSLVDRNTVTFGFREAVFRQEGFYLNGKMVKICGLNRHQSWPYVGYAMPRRPQRLDADILKFELGLNAVRTAHYPQSQHFINRCDEIGLLVFTELPGWQHIGDAPWKDAAVEATADMVRQYRNHPSVILWGVRVNESQDDDAFYSRTNAVAHQLDPTRQTGGVRYLRKSNLLEDVYTYNDFLHNGRTPGLAPKKAVTPDEKAPYLVTEYNGHMFPTKSFDDENHRLEHARRHARVVSAMYKGKGVAGCFGWCMFDYNTHKDFGSGDGICYHGVMDMYRNPKLAAAVYASQQEAYPVLEISSTMNIGEHPAGYLGDIYAFTNGDSVRLYKNDELIKEFYPLKKDYPAMAHPPVVIDDLVGDLMEKNEGFSHSVAEGLKRVLRAVSRFGQNGLPLRYLLQMPLLMLRARIGFKDGVRLFMTYIGNWGDAMPLYRFEAVKEGQVVAVAQRGPVTGARLEAKADTSRLVHGASYDVATVRLSAKGADGSPLPYLQEPVALSATGPVAIIGPEVISLRGGMGGTYLRTTGGPGQAVLTLDGGPLGRQQLAFEVACEGETGL